MKKLLKSEEFFFLTTFFICGVLIYAVIYFADYLDAM